MASDNDAPRPPQRSQATAGGGARAESAAVARGLLRRTWKASLSTVAREGGHPYGSLVAMACEPSGAPLLLLSGLAEHTRNLAADQRASLLIDATSEGRAALTGARVTLVGRISEATSDTARRRYLARHPDAAAFVDFGDFAIYTLELEWAHLVAGFGRIVRLTPADMLTRTDDAASLIAAEQSIVEHMNVDHPDALALMATRLGGQSTAEPDSGGETSPWSMISCDPDGFDMTDGSRAGRILFPHRVMDPEQVRKALVEMVRSARTAYSTDK